MAACPPGFCRRTSQLVDASGNQSSRGHARRQADRVQHLLVVSDGGPRGRGRAPRRGARHGEVKDLKKLKGAEFDKAYADHEASPTASSPHRTTTFLR